MFGLCSTCVRLKLNACFSQSSGAVGLVIIAENDTRTLLIHRISFDDIYQRQGGWLQAFCISLICFIVIAKAVQTADVQRSRRCCRTEDTIITWMDAELETDIALSFQEENGCNVIWQGPQEFASLALSQIHPAIYMLCTWTRTSLACI